MNTPMTPQELEHELLRQQVAEQREYTRSSEHDDASIEQYRLIHRILKKDDLPALPSNFAAKVAKQLMDFEERAQFENTAMIITLVIAAFAGIFYALPQLLQSLQNFSKSVELPVSMLWSVTFALAFAAMIDKVSTRHRSHKP